MSVSPGVFASTAIKSGTIGYENPLSRIVNWKPVSKTVLLLLIVVFSRLAFAEPVVDGNTIHLPDDGWYQVQSASDYRSICEGERQCEVDNGTYIVINHSTGTRWENVEVGGARIPDTGFVFSRTDTREFRWVEGDANVWIDEACAESLGGANRSGNWHELNEIAPQFDAIDNPCTAVRRLVGSETYAGYLDAGGMEKLTVSGAGRITVGSDDGVFNVHVVDENGVHVCELFVEPDVPATCPGYHLTETAVLWPAVEYSLEIYAYQGGSYQIVTESGLDGGFVFSRTDKTEYRWVVDGDNILITEECAGAIGGATQYGTWVELDRIAPGHDLADNPCTLFDERLPILTAGNIYQFPLDAGGEHEFRFKMEQFDAIEVQVPAAAYYSYRLVPTTGDAICMVNSDEPGFCPGSLYSRLAEHQAEQGDDSLTFWLKVRDADHVVIRLPERSEGYLAEDPASGQHYWVSGFVATGISEDCARNRGWNIRTMEVFAAGIQLAGEGAETDPCSELVYPVPELTGAFDFTVTPDNSGGNGYSLDEFVLDRTPGVRLISSENAYTLMIVFDDSESFFCFSETTCPDGGSEFGGSYDSYDRDQRYSLFVISTAGSYRLQHYDPEAGYVFRRTDIDEFRWVVGRRNVWISRECAESLDAPVKTGDWRDLNAVSPQFDAIPRPC